MTRFRLSLVRVRRFLVYKAVRGWHGKISLPSSALFHESKRHNCHIEMMSTIQIWASYDASLTLSDSKLVCVAEGKGRVPRGNKLNISTPQVRLEPHKASLDCEPPSFRFVCWAVVSTIPNLDVESELTSTSTTPVYEHPFKGHLTQGIFACELQNMNK